MGKIPIRYVITENHGSFAYLIIREATVRIFFYPALPERSHFEQMGRHRAIQTLHKLSRTHFSSFLSNITLPELE